MSRIIVCDCCGKTLHSYESVHILAELHQAGIQNEADLCKECCKKVLDFMVDQKAGKRA